MSILTNVDRYGKMVEALNNFYWDNSISPNETAARLDEFAAEVSRLAKFIRDNDPALDRAAELPLERNAQQNCPDCGGSGYLVDEEGNEHQCLLCL